MIDYGGLRCALINGQDIFNNIVKMDPNSRLSAKSETTFKEGFRAFLERHAVIVKRFQYGIIIIICSAVLAIQCIECINKYLAKKTATADKYVHVSKTTFPALTICAS